MTEVGEHSVTKNKEAVLKVRQNVEQAGFVMYNCKEPQSKDNYSIHNYCES
jgi:hypothetical protein